MSKKSTVAALALALAGLAAAPLANAADTPATPAGTEQKNPVARRKRRAILADPLRKKQLTLAAQQILVALKNVNLLIKLSAC